MKFSVLKDRVIALVMILGLAMLSCMSASTAFAAAGKPDATSKAKGMADAPALIAGGKIPCELTDAYLIGGANVTVDGKQQKAQTYEVACKTGPGWILTATSPTTVEQPFTCTMASTYKAKRPDMIQCVLPENVPDYTWLNDVAKPYTPDCVVNKARLVGSTTTEPKIDRYEYGCTTTAGGMIDIPQIGSTAKLRYINCLTQDGSSSACQYTTKEQAIAVIKPAAAKGSPACVISDARYLGVNTDQTGTYYEIGCSNQPGFVVLAASTDNSLIRTVPCTAAAGLGGCKFTSAGAAAADLNATYTKTLKDHKIACTVSDFNVIGEQAATKRDYVEFKCPEQPFGLIGFVPQADSKSDLALTDCFVDQVRHKSCTYVTPADMQKQVDKLIKLKEPTKGCDVKDVRYIGESSDDDGSLIVEIACVNKRGYIAIIDKVRKSLLVADPCRLAAAHKDAQKCTIPDNGTYVE